MKIAALWQRHARPSETLGVQASKGGNCAQESRRRVVRVSSLKVGSAAEHTNTLRITAGEKAGYVECAPGSQARERASVALCAPLKSIHDE